MSSISANYPTPVMVNGYSCRNCTEVDEAKKNIDPANPKAGPFGRNATSDSQQSNAVSFGGSLAGLNSATGASLVQPPQATGSQVNISC